MNAANTTSRTQVDAKLAAAQRRHTDPVRIEILERTRRFKSSWYDLGAVLASCQQKRLWKKWGYTAFDEYVRKELHMRTATAYKLIGSFSYLASAAPEVLERDGVHREIPSAESVEFLSKAAQACGTGRVSSDVLEQVRAAVIEDGLPLASLQKQFGPVLSPEDAAQLAAKKRREAIRTAARLVSGFEGLRGSVPDAVLSQAWKSVNELLAALDAPAPAAAAELPPPALPALELPPPPPAAPAAPAAAPAPAEPYDTRVKEAHQKAVAYLMTVQDPSGETHGGLERMRKSLQWHLRRLSDKNLGLLASLFPDPQWRELMSAAAQDALLRRALDAAARRNPTLLPPSTQQALAQTGMPLHQVLGHPAGARVAA